MDAEKSIGYSIKCNELGKTGLVTKHQGPDKLALPELNTSLIV